MVRISIRKVFLLDWLAIPFSRAQTFLCRERRKEFEQQKGLVEQIIYEGTQKMVEISNETLKEMRSVMGIGGTWNKISRMARDRM